MIKGLENKILWLKMKVIHLGENFTIIFKHKNLYYRELYPATLRDTADRIEELDQINNTKGNFLTMVTVLEKAVKEVLESRKVSMINVF